MKAEIRDLGIKKYYGTEVVIRGDDGRPISEAKVWLGGRDRTPSARQLADWDVAGDEAELADLMSDSHYETAESYRAASEIAAAINGHSPA